MSKPNGGEVYYRRPENIVASGRQKRIRELAASLASTTETKDEDDLGEWLAWAALFHTMPTFRQFQFFQSFRDGGGAKAKKAFLLHFSQSVKDILD